MIKANDKSMSPEEVKTKTLYTVPSEGVSVMAESPEDAVRLAKLKVKKEKNE